MKRENKETVLNDRFADLSGQVMLLVSLEDLRELIRTTVRETLSALKDIKEEPIVWLTPEQASKRLKKSLPTLWRWEKEGYLTSERFGRRCRYKESDIIAIEQAEKKGGVK